MVPRSQIRSALSKRQLQIFASIGVAEGVVFNVQLYAAARLPGVLIVVLQQAILPFVMGASTLMLGRRYSSAQVRFLQTCFSYPDTTADSLKAPRRRMCNRWSSH